MAFPPLPEKFPAPPPPPDLRGRDLAFPPLPPAKEITLLFGMPGVATPPIPKLVLVELSPAPAPPFAAKSIGPVAGPEK